MEMNDHNTQHQAEIDALKGIQLSWLYDIYSMVVCFGLYDDKTGVVKRCT
jgi:hypothetical protein